MSDQDHELRLKHYREYLQDYRGIRDVCHRCGGAGVVSYGDTSTWRGGIGGQVITRDVCEHCWGSGDEHDHWTDLRKLEQSQRDAITSEASQYFNRWLNVTKGEADPALAELATELDKMSRGRKERSQWYYHTCKRLSVMLKRLATGEHIDLSEDE